MNKNNEYHFEILASCKYEFMQTLYNCMLTMYADLLNNEQFMILTQMRDMDMYKVDDYITREFKRADGQYLYKAEFISRPELLSKVKPFCKAVSVSFVPKNFKDSYDSASDERLKKDFGRLSIEMINLNYKK